MCKDGVVGWDGGGFDVDVEIEGLRGVGVEYAAGEWRGLAQYGEIWAGVKVCGEGRECQVLVGVVRKFRFRVLPVENVE